MGEERQKSVTFSQNEHWNFSLCSSFSHDNQYESLCRRAMIGLKGLHLINERFKKERDRFENG